MSATGSKDACTPERPCIVPPPTCKPPELLLCFPIQGSSPPATACECARTGGPSEPPREVGRLCTVAMVYQANNPASVYIGPLEHGCDQAGLEIALAVLLAKILTGPPLP